MGAEGRPCGRVYPRGISLGYRPGRGVALVAEKIKTPVESQKYLDILCIVVLYYLAKGVDKLDSNGSRERSHEGSGSSSFSSLR